MLLLPLKSRLTTFEVVELGASSSAGEAWSSSELPWS
jgi:hypothetical protein